MDPRPNLNNAAHSFLSDLPEIIGRSWQCVEHHESFPTGEHVQTTYALDFEDGAKLIMIYLRRCPKES